MPPPVSRLDQVYRSLVLSKFFSRGWGSPEHLKRLFEFRKLVGVRETCLKLVDPDHTITIDKVKLDESGEFKLIDGHFFSPFAQHQPGLLPKVAENAYFQLVVPEKWTTHDRPLCIHMAGTGDHHFWRRRNLVAKPLLKDHGIASLIMENPFYGLRKPEEQFRSSLLNVSDIFVMGGSLILESIAILQWCEKEGYGPLVMHGISMGGHMASLGAATWGKPICIVPCLSWSTASGSFTQGVLSGAVDWKVLEQQYFSENVYKDEFYKLVSDSDEAYLAGKDFVSQYKTTPTFKAGSVKSDPEKNSLFHGLTTFLRDRGLLKLLPNFNSAVPSVVDLITEDAPKGFGMIDVGNGVIGKTKLKVQKEAIQFMRGVMDEFTHLKNYARPVDNEMIIIVAAKHDGYVPRDGCTGLDSIWPGCEVRIVDSGHVAGYLLHQGMFRKSIADAVDRYRMKYNQDGTLRASSATKIRTAATNKVVEEVLGYQNDRASPSIDQNPRL